MPYYPIKKFSRGPKPEASYGSSPGRSETHAGRRTGGYSWAIIVQVILLLFSSLPPVNATVQVEVIHSQDKYPAGRSYPIHFKLLIPASWYLHGAEGRGIDFISTVLAFQPPSDIEIKDIRFPDPVLKKFDYGDRAVPVFSGEILVQAMMNVNPKTKPGRVTVNGQLSYQACTDTLCMPPEERPIALELNITSAGGNARHSEHNTLSQKGVSANERRRHPGLGFEAGFWLTLLGIFFGGMALNLTPCIYPLIPITVSYFGGMSKNAGGRTIVHGILYISGLAISNSALGVTASLTGGMMGELLQKPAVLVLVAGMLIFLALSFFDLWELRLPRSLTRVATMNFGGYFGTLFMGLTLGIVAAPCLGPFMLGLLTYVAQLGDPLLGFLYFFVLSIGMGLPLAMLAIFSGALKNLPLSGGWLMWIRKGLGWVLIGMAGYILRTLVPDITIRAVVGAIISFMAGLHLGWLDRSTGNFRYFRIIKKGLGTTLFCTAAVIFLIGFTHKAGQGIAWLPYEPARLEDAAQQNRPVILDFYAEWCAPCRELDKEVFSDPEVIELSKHFDMIRADMTTKHPYQDEFKKRYQFRGAPTILFINKKGRVEKGLSIESYVKKDIVLDRMNRLISDSPDSQ
jgi:thioredoxin:protein disulfide reductase